MYTKPQVVFDAADPGKLAAFWKAALGYRGRREAGAGARHVRDDRGPDCR